MICGLTYDKRMENRCEKIVLKKRSSFLTEIFRIEKVAQLEKELSHEYVEKVFYTIGQKLLLCYIML
jgi:hypothetical protein